MKKQKLSFASGRKNYRKLLARFSGAALLCSAILGSSPSNAQAPGNPKQNPVWLMSNNSAYASTKHNKFRFYYNGSAVVQHFDQLGLVSEYSAQNIRKVTHVFNSMPDYNGNLNFFIGLLGPVLASDALGAENSMGDVHIIGSDGHFIGQFTSNSGGPSNMYNYPEFLTVPLGNSCTATGLYAQPGYVIIAYNNGKIWYAVTYPGTPSNPANHIVYGTHNPDTDLGWGAMNTINSITATFAAPKPVAGRKQYVYMASNEGIHKFTINPLATIPLNVNGGTVTTEGKALNNTTDIWIYNGFANTNELEISEDGKKLAWADMLGNTVYVQDLDPVTGNAIGTPKSISITGLNANQINGLEFIPNSSGTGYSLYVTAGSDNSSANNNGLYRINWNGTSYPISISATTDRIGGFLYAGTVAQSHIETDYTGNMVLLTPDRLLRIHPVTNAYLSQMFFSKALQGTTYGSVRRLPRQIDGWDYNVAGMVYGPASVKVSGSGAAPTQTYSVPQLPGATYSWSYSGPGGTVQLGTGASQTITFPNSPLGTYTLNVAVAYNNQCQTQTTATLNVITNDGSIPDGSRMAKPTDRGESATYPTATVYPNPATDRFELQLPAMEQEAVVRIVDMNGKTCKTFTANRQQQTVEVSNLKSGVYLLHVEAGKQVATQRLVILN
jgi:hypothetical protein